MESNKQSIKTVTKHKQKKHCRRRCRRHRSTRNIHQKIELNKKDFQCIINLNTTICEHKASQSQLNTTICHVSHQSNCESRVSSLNRESRQVSSVNQEPISIKPQHYSRGRIAPFCFRDKCQSWIQKCRFRDERRDHVNNMMAKHHHYSSCSSSRNHRRDSTGTKKHQDRYRKHRNDTIKLSPISSSPLKDDLHHLYEDISNDSLDKIINTPKSYKNIRYYVENKVESKLDTLIRRTKERERKLVAESRNKRSYSISSSASSNISSGEFPMDLGTMDSASLASRTTLVLENSQSDCIYLSSEVEKSPEYLPSDFNVKKCKYRQLCSPESFSKTNTNMNTPMKYQFEKKNSPEYPLEGDFIMDNPKKYKYGSLCSFESSSKNDLNMNILRKYECEQLNSLGTLIQGDFIKNEPQKHNNRQLCSPTTTNYCNMEIFKKCENKQRHSPRSPLQSDFIASFAKKQESNYKIAYIKSEPLDMGIGVYSPTFDYSKEELKKEIIADSKPFESGIQIDIKKEID